MAEIDNDCNHSTSVDVDPGLRCTVCHATDATTRCANEDCPEAWCLACDPGVPF